MRSLVSLLILLLPAIVCAGQQVVGTPTQGPRRTITGTVVNAQSGEPIHRAMVQIWGASPSSALTGPDGRFTVDGILEGPLNISVSKPGFFDARSVPQTGDSQSTQKYTVGSGNNDFHLVLFPAARIVGRLTDQDGEAIEQTQVQLLTEQVVNGHKQVVQRGGSSTDDDGEYRIDDLVPGKYMVFAAGHSLPASNWDGPADVSPPAYFPDAPDLASARIIELQPGQEFRADFHLRTQPGFRVSGTVGGYPAVFGLMFSLENSTGQQVLNQGESADRPQGQFVVRAVPSGTWTLRLSTNDAQGHTYEAREEIAVNGADIRNLQILLHAAASIPVTVNHPASQEEGAPAQRQFNPGISATLLPADSYSNPRSSVLGAHNDPAALFFDNVMPGKYKLNVQNFGANECVESAWYGNVDLLRDYLVVGSEGGTQPLTINMTKDCATLSAQIAPGQEQNSGVLVVVSTSSSIAEPIVFPVMSQGAALGRLRGLSLILCPGTYQVYAFKSVEGLEYANPEVLRDYPSQSIDLASGQKAELSVKLSERKAN